MDLHLQHNKMKVNFAQSFFLSSNNKTFLKLETYLGR